MRITTNNGLHRDASPTYSRRLYDWLGLEEVGRRRWLARLPAIVVAAIIMAMFVWTVDIGQMDMTLVLCLALLSIAIGLQAAVK